MNNSFLIFFTIFLITGLIYLLYKIMLGSQKDTDEDLQITSEEIVAHLGILHKQKKYTIVETLAKKYLEKKSRDVSVRIIYAKTLFESGKINEAIEQAKIVLRLEPENISMQIFKANCYLKSADPMKAINVLQKVVEEDPDNIVAVKELAQVYYDTNQKKSALKMYIKLDEFLENSIEKAKNKITIAEIHTAYKDYHLAIHEYLQVLEFYPNDTTVKKRLIELYKLTSDYRTLIQLAGQVYSAFPDSEDGLWAMKMLMFAFNETKDYDRALEMANLIKAHLLSDKIESSENIAKILIEKDQMDESVQMLKETIAQDPKNIGLKKTLAGAYQKMQEFEAAVSIYKKLIDEADIKDVSQLQYEISNIYSNWGMYLFLQKENDECFKRFQSALKYYTQNPEIYYRMGCINKEIKNINEAISNFKKAIDLDSENVEYYYEIAECYAAVDNVYEQRRVLVESLNYVNTNPEVYFNLGMIHRLQNDLDSAISYFEKAIDLNNDYNEAKLKLALAYEYVGNKEEAKRLYEDILKHDPENEEVANNLRMLKS